MENTVTPPAVAPVEAKAATVPIEQFLPATLIQLLSAAPQNEQLRARVLAITRKYIPNAIQTWDGIKEWLEANVDMGKVSAVDKAAIRTPGQATPAADLVSFDITGSGREWGRCHYSVDTFGRTTVQMSPARLRSLVNEALENGCETQTSIHDHVLDGLREYIDEEGLEPTQEWGDDSPDYTDHEQSDSESNGWGFSNQARVWALAVGAVRSDEAMYQRLIGMGVTT